MPKLKECENCGVGNPQDSLFCKNCGEKFGGAEETTTKKKTQEDNIELRKIPKEFEIEPVHKTVGTVYEDKVFKMEVLNRLERIEKTLLG